jgi:peptide deformylase
MSAIVKDIDKLKKVSEPASEEEAKDIICKLEKELSKHENGIGLSAIQIGIPKNIFIIRNQEI